jgi:formate dehydrogenase beta subunit
MAKIIYGVWDGKVLDNRNKNHFDIEELPEFRHFDEFNPGNPIKAFWGGYGFLVFEPGVYLLDAALQYMRRITAASCGKCTPCRVGTCIIQSKLELLANNSGTPQLLDEIEVLAEHIHSTSLCGLGQTATVALLGLLRHFRNEVFLEMREDIPQPHQPCYTYVTAPCIEACPAKVDVPKYIGYIRDGQTSHSLGVILQKYPMAATCGRVCVRFCELACRRTLVDEAVGIKVLKRYVADHEQHVINEWFSRDLIDTQQSRDLKSAVIGAGPAGISAAYHLLLKGYPVDMFEALPAPGGMAATGIPNYRLPKDVLHQEISIIQTLGGNIFYNRRMGVDFSLHDLMAQGYRAIFLGLGAPMGKMLGVPGEDNGLRGYEFGIELLLHINAHYLDEEYPGELDMDNTPPLDLGNKVVVIGGGNVAMDCVRSALRMGVKEVHLVYRRSRREMPADPEEIEAAEKEGVMFHFLTHPTKIIAEDGAVKALELIKMELGAPDESGRRSVRPVAGSERVLEVDFVVPAIGQRVDHRSISPEDGVMFDKWGLIEVDNHTLMTNRKGIFAGGDCVTGPATLIQAMAHGYDAAQYMDDYLTHGRVLFHPENRMGRLLSSLGAIERKELLIPVKPEYRVQVQELDPNVRKKIFEEVEKPISADDAYREATRCMRCYRVYSVITEQ